MEKKPLRIVHTVSTLLNGGMEHFDFYGRRFDSGCLADEPLGEVGGYTFSTGPRETR